MSGLSPSFHALASDEDEADAQPLVGTVGVREADSVSELRRQLAEQQRLVSDLLASGGARPYASAPVVVAPIASSSTVVVKSDEDIARELAAMEEHGSSSLLGNDYDAQIARDMQQMEIMLAQQQQQQTDVPEAPEAMTMEDPVWGKFTAPPAGYKPHQILCISMCPCCVGPYCSPERKDTYKRLSRTACFILSMIQLALVLISLCFEGFAPLAENPMLGPPGIVLDEMGAKDTRKIVVDYQLWRLVTPIFLHAGFIHLLTNLVMQLRLAIFLEIKWGLKTFLIIYFLAGVFSSCFSAVCIPQSIGVGASGALMGIMGAWFVDILSEWGDGDRQDNQQRAFQLVMCFVNMTVILSFSFVKMIDWAAHAFGMLGGILVNMYLLRDKFSGRKHIIMKWGGSVLYLSLLSITFIVMFTSIKSNKSYLPDPQR